MSILAAFNVTRRVVFFYLATILDINECELNFLQESEQGKDVYFSNLCGSIVREVSELYESVLFLSADSPKVLFRLFHQKLRAKLKRQGQRNPNESLLFWEQRTNQVVLLVLCRSIS